MRPLIFGLIGGLIATLLAVLSVRTQRNAAIDSDGWRVIRPGWYLHFAFFGSAAFAAFMAYIYFFVGSSRADADEQVIYMLLIIVGFGLAAIYVGWSCYTRVVSYKNACLKISNIFGSERTYDLKEVIAVKEFSGLGEYRFTFRDGTKLRVSSYLNGVHDLIDRLPEHVETNF